jgi:hypothetical protein
VVIGGFGMNRIEPSDPAATVLRHLCLRQKLVLLVGRCRGFVAVARKMTLVLLVQWNRVFVGRKMTLVLLVQWNRVFMGRKMTLVLLAHSYRIFVAVTGKMTLVLLVQWYRGFVTVASKDW